MSTPSKLPFVIVAALDGNGSLGSLQCFCTMSVQ